MRSNVSARPEIGRMTAAMRAASAPRAPRVLRVARVVSGRIVEERLVAACNDVELFEGAPGAYVLRTPSGATGHVILGGRRVTIGPAPQRLALADAARGKIVVGRETILFQLVVPPPRPARPKLPLAVTRKAIDWPLTILAAFSFLFHFGVVGATFSDWLDPVVGDEAATVKLVDLTPARPLAPVIEDQGSEGKRSAAQTETRGPVTIEEAPGRPSRAADLAREAESMRMGLLAAFGGGPAVKGAIDRGDIPFGELDSVARDPRGAEATGGELALAHGMLGRTPGADPLSRLGRTGVDPSGPVHVRPVEGPRVDVTIAPPQGEPTTCLIEPSIARLRPSYRSCYVRKGLSVNPTMEGKVVLDIAIAPNGEVSNVTKIGGSGLSPEVEACIMQRTRAADFPAPGGSGAHAHVPVIFKLQ